MSETTISVVIPAYRAAATIGRAVESLMRQSRRPDEIIVVDDGSPEDLAPALQRFGTAVTLVRQENGGAASARNFGISRAIGDLIGFLDADDYWESNKLERQLDVLRKHPEVGMIGCQWFEQTPGQSRVPAVVHAPSYFDRLLRPSGAMAFHVAMCVWTSTLLVRRNVLAQHRFVTGLEPAEDRDLWIRLASCTAVYLLGQPLATYVLEPNSLSRGNVDRDCGNMMRVVHRHAALLGRRGVWRQEMIVYRRWAAGHLGRHDPAAARRPAWLRLKHQPWSAEAWWVLAKSVACSSASSRPNPPTGVAHVPSTAPTPVRRVVHLLDFTPNGKRSMEVFLVRFAEKLKSQGLDSVFVFAGPPGAYFKAEAGRLNATCLEVEFPLSLRDAIRLGLRLRRFRPCLLTTAYISKFSPATLLLHRVSGASRLVIQDRSSGSASSKKGPRRWAAMARGAVLGRCTDRVIAVSHFVRRRDVEEVFLPPKRVRAVWNGVDVCHFARQRQERLVTSDGPPTVVYAGQLTRAKGLQTLLEAAAQLEASGRQFRLLVAGTGELAGEFRRYCDSHRLHQVEFLGQVADVSALIASADVVVVPSEWEEAFGYIVAEAMAAGACVLGSDAGAIPELLVSDGEKAGVVFRRGDVTDLSDRLGELLDDPAARERLGAIARARAGRLFSIDRAVSEYMDVIAEIF